MKQISKIVTLIFLTVFISAANANEVDLATGTVAEICGILRHETRWGPPNFGENKKTDSKFIVWIVSMQKSVNISAGKETGKPTVERLSEIQLSIPVSKYPIQRLQRLDGKIVRASGTLWTATSQGDVTSVVMALSEISLGNDKYACITKN